MKRTGPNSDLASDTDSLADAPPPTRWQVPLILTLYIAAMALSVLLLLVGTGLLGGKEHIAFAMAGLIGFLLSLTLGPLSFILVTRGDSATHLGQLSRQLEEVREALYLISSQSSLSDDARRVINRATEREMLRRAIQQDINSGDYEAGLVLCRELADRFGYRQDAEEFRARIEVARAELLDRAIREGVAVVEGLILQRLFIDAAREAGRLARLYPEEARVLGLPGRVGAARGEFTEELRRRFFDAAQGDRIDEAMDLLKQLDGYLSPPEAGTLMEVARGVVSKARENLGAMFKIAVHDRHWSEAASIGRRIVMEFPNSKMAGEVRALLDGVLSRANSQRNGS